MEESLHPFTHKVPAQAAEGQHDAEADHAQAELDVAGERQPHNVLPLHVAIVAVDGPRYVESHPAYLVCLDNDDLSCRALAHR